MRLPQYESHDDPRVEEAELAVRLFHAANMNPKFTVGGVQGFELALSALQIMGSHKLAQYEEYAFQTADQIYQDLHTKGNHSSLTTAVKIAAGLKDKEALLEAWYARELVEAEILESFDVASTLDKDSVTERFYSKQELDIALLLARDGRDGANGAVKRMAGVRVDSAWSCMVGLDKALIRRRLLYGCVDNEEFREIGRQDDVRFGYNILKITAEKVASAGVDEDLAEYAAEIKETAYAAVAELALVSAAGDTRLLAAELMPQMLKSDPENQKYKTLHKKLHRHFRRSSYNTREFIRGPYTSIQVQNALRSLGVMTLEDALMIMSEVAALSGEDTNDKNQIARLET